jgi:hypothetical protein
MGRPKHIGIINKYTHENCNCEIDIQIWEHVCWSQPMWNRQWIIWFPSTPTMRELLLWTMRSDESFGDGIRTLKFKIEC